MQELIIIYNAKSGLFNKSVDYLHKFFSPKTYTCDLCTITHSNFGPKNDWAKFISEVNVRTQFKYCNQRSPDEQAYECPVVLLHVKDGLQQIVGPNEFKKLSLHELISLLKSKIN